MSESNKVFLNTYELAKRWNKSPRTLEAVKRLGLSLEELEPVNRDECRKYYQIRDKVAVPPAELVDLRYNMLD